MINFKTDEALAHLKFKSGVSLKYPMFFHPCRRKEALFVDICHRHGHKKRWFQRLLHELLIRKCRPEVFEPKCGIYIKTKGSHFLHHYHHYTSVMCIPHTCNQGLLLESCNLLFQTAPINFSILVKIACVLYWVVKSSK
jgi:hypothetical protein